jgi:hypothetical protein
LTGGVLKVFVDGNLVSATNVAQAPESEVTSDLWIGNDVAEPPYHFQGLLDDITIYNRALVALVSDTADGEAVEVVSITTYFQRC